MQTSLLLILDQSMTIEMGTCTAQTNIGNSVTVLDEDLNVIGTSGRPTTRSCAVLSGIQVEAGKPYVIVITPVAIQARLGGVVQGLGMGPGRGGEGRCTAQMRVPSRGPRRSRGHARSSPPGRPSSLPHSNAHACMRCCMHRHNWLSSSPSGCGAVLPARLFPHHRLCRPSSLACK